MRFSGRRRSAIRPRGDERDARRAARARRVASLCGSWSLVITSDQRDGRLGERRRRSRGANVAACSSEQRPDGRARELGLRDEPARAAGGDQLAVVGRVAARDEHDRRRRCRSAQRPLATSNPSRSGSCTSSRTISGSELADLGERLGAVRGLADDRRSPPPRAAPRGRAEARVVVDDQNGRRHARIVAERGASRPYG